MKNTIIRFSLICLDENSFLVDPTTLYIDGFFNWNMLHDFLFEKKDSCLADIGESMEKNEHKDIELEIWVDSDDYRSWIDFKIMPLDNEDFGNNNS